MAEKDANATSFWDHTREFLSRLRISITAILVSSIAIAVVPTDLESLRLSMTSPVYNSVATVAIKRMLSDLLPAGAELLPIDWFAPFLTYMYVSLFLGIIISSPIILYEVYKFIGPALYSNEQKYIVIFTASFTLLFIFGLTLGYFLVMPITFQMLIGSSYLLGLLPRYEFSNFFSLVLGGLFVCGIFFTFPVFFLILVKFGILKTSIITGKRTIFYVALYALLFILTPDPTPITGTIIFLPILFLMEASLFIGKRIERGKEI
jgi:Tat protein translocase TatC